MKIASPALFRLVNGLTQGERRYFYQYAHRYQLAAPNYYRIYEVLLEMPAWDANTFAELLTERINAAHLPVLKHQLYERILDALDQYYRQRDPEEVIKQQLHQAYLLLRRDLGEAARKRFEKAKKKLVEQQMYHLWPAAMQLELLILERELRRRTATSSAVDWQADYEEGLALLREQMAAAAAKFAAYEQHFRTLSSSRTAHVFINPEPRTLIAQADQLQTRALHAFIDQKPSQARELNTILLRTLEQIPKGQKNIPERYLSAFYNWLFDQLQLAQYSALRTGLVRLRELPKQKDFQHLRHLESRIFEWSYQLELNADLQQAAFSTAYQRLADLQQGLKVHGKRLSGPGFAGLHHLGGLIAFHAHDYQMALSFLQPLYQESRPQIARDIYRHARYLHLLCHYELAHFDLVENLLLNSKRTAQQSKDIAAEELYFLNRLQHLLKHPDKRKAIRKEWLSTHSKVDSSLEKYLFLSVWLGEGASD